MTASLDGNAVVYCEGAFTTTNGKTAHGLVRRTERYHVAAVIDSTCAGRDAGEVLDGKPAGIPIVADLAEALEVAEAAGHPASHLVVGLAPDGGRLPPEARAFLQAALEAGLNVDCGLHDFLSEDEELSMVAEHHGVTLRDIRRPPHRSLLHGFSGRIAEVESKRVALLGTDSAVGKRTTAWVLIDGLRARGLAAELIGTGQTAWLQGARYGIVLDSLPNDFLAGEIEHACVRAWDEARPDWMVLEGQGSLLNPAYPGGYELLAAGRPHAVVLQHAPGRVDYDGFPGFPIQPIETQIQAVELISGRPVVAITLNHEGIPPERTGDACQQLADRTGLPVVDVLRHGPDALVEAVVAAVEDST